LQLHRRLSDERKRCIESNTESQQDDEITTPPHMTVNLNRMWNKFRGVRTYSKFFLGWQQLKEE
jgi:hypothetical protein